MLLEAYAAPVVELVDLFEDWATIKIAAAPLYHNEGSLGNGSRPSRYEISFLCLSVDPQGNPRAPRRSVLVDVELPSMVVALTDLYPHGVYDIDVRGVTTGVDALRKNNTIKGGNERNDGGDNGGGQGSGWGLPSVQKTIPLVGKWARQHVALVPPICIQQGTVEETALHVVWDFGGWAAPTITATTTTAPHGGDANVMATAPATHQSDDVVSFRSASDRRPTGHQSAAVVPINIVSLFEVEIRRTSSADPTPQVERLAVAFVPGVTPFGGSRRIPIERNKRPDRDGEDAVYVVRVRAFRPHGLACDSPGEGQYGSWSSFKRFVCIRTLDVTVTDIGVNSCRVVWRRRRVAVTGRGGGALMAPQTPGVIPDTVNPAITDCHLQCWEALRTTTPAMHHNETSAAATTRDIHHSWPPSYRAVLHTRHVSVEPQQLRRHADRGGNEDDGGELDGTHGSMALASLEPDCVYHAQFTFRYVDGDGARCYRWFRFATHAAPCIDVSSSTVGARCIVAAMRWQRHREDGDQGSGTRRDQCGGGEHNRSRIDLMSGGFVEDETAEDVIACNLRARQLAEEREEETENQARRSCGSDSGTGGRTTTTPTPRYVPILDDHRGVATVHVSDAQRRHPRRRWQGDNTASGGEEQQVDVAAEHRLSHLMPCVYHVQALHRGVVVAERFALHAPSAIRAPTTGAGESASSPCASRSTTDASTSGAVLAAQRYRTASDALWRGLVEHPEDRLDALTNDLAPPRTATGAGGTATTGGGEDGVGGAFVLLDPLPEASLLTMRVRCGMLSDVSLAAFLRQRRDQLTQRQDGSESPSGVAAAGAEPSTPSSSCVDDLSAICLFSSWWSQSPAAATPSAAGVGDADALRLQTLSSVDPLVEQRTPTSVTLAFVSESASEILRCSSTGGGSRGVVHAQAATTIAPKMCAVATLFVCVMSAGDNEGRHNDDRCRQFKREWVLKQNASTGAGEEDDDREGGPRTAANTNANTNAIVAQFLCASGQSGRLERMTNALGVAAVTCARIDIESLDAADPLVNSTAPVVVHRVPMLDHRLLRVDGLTPGGRYVIAWNAQDACGVWYGGRHTTVATLPLPAVVHGDEVHEGGRATWEAPGTQHVCSNYHPVLDKDFFQLPTDTDADETHHHAALPVDPTLDGERLETLRYLVGGANHSLAARHARNHQTDHTDNQREAARSAPLYTLGTYLASKVEPIGPLRLAVDMVGSAEVVLVWNDFLLQQRQRSGGAGEVASPPSLTSASYGQEYRLHLRWSPLPHRLGASAAPHALLNEPHVASRDFFFRCSDIAGSNRLRLSNLSEDFAHTASISVFDKRFHRWSTWSEPVRFTVTSRLELTLTTVTPNGFDVAWRRRHTTVDPRAIGNPIAPEKYEISVERRSWTSLVQPTPSTTAASSSAPIATDDAITTNNNSFATVVVRPPASSASVAPDGSGVSGALVAPPPHDASISTVFALLERTWMAAVDPSMTTFHTVQAAPASGYHVPSLALGCYRCRVRPHHAYGAIGPWSDATYVAITPLHLATHTVRQMTCDVRWTVAAAAVCGHENGRGERFDATQQDTTRQDQSGAVAQQKILAQLERRPSDNSQAQSPMVSGPTNSAAASVASPIATTRYFEINGSLCHTGGSGGATSSPTAGSYRCEPLAAGATYTLRGTVVSTRMPGALHALLSADKTASSTAIDGRRGATARCEGDANHVHNPDAPVASDPPCDPSPLTAPAPSILRSRIATSKFPLLAAARLRRATAVAARGNTTSDNVNDIDAGAYGISRRYQHLQRMLMLLDTILPIAFTTLPMVDSVTVTSVGAKDALVSWTRVVALQQQQLPPQLSPPAAPALPHQPASPPYASLFNSTPTIPTATTAAAAPLILVDDEVYTVVVMDSDGGDIVVLSTVTPTSRPVASSMRGGRSMQLSKRVDGLLPLHRYRVAVVPYPLLLPTCKDDDDDDGRHDGTAGIENKGRATTSSSHAPRHMSIHRVREHLFGNRSLMFTAAFSTHSPLEIFWRLTPVTATGAAVAEGDDGAAGDGCCGGTSVLGTIEVVVTRCAAAETGEGNGTYLHQRGQMTAMTMPSASADGGTASMRSDVFRPRLATGCMRLIGYSDHHHNDAGDGDADCSGILRTAEDVMCHLGDGSVVTSVVSPHVTEISVTMQTPHQYQHEGPLNTAREEEEEEEEDLVGASSMPSQRREQRVVRRRFKASGATVSRVAIPYVQRGTRLLVVVRQKDCEGQWDDDAWKKATIVL